MVFVNQYKKAFSVVAYSITMLIILSSKTEWGKIPGLVKNQSLFPYCMLVLEAFVEFGRIWL